MTVPPTRRKVKIRSRAMRISTTPATVPRSIPAIVRDAAREKKRSTRERGELSEVNCLNIPAAVP